MNVRNFCSLTFMNYSWMFINSSWSPHWDNVVGVTQTSYTLYRHCFAKPKKQYPLTVKVSTYCLLALRQTSSQMSGHLSNIPIFSGEPISKCMNEGIFRCTYRLKWTRRCSWGWYDESDDTVPQKQGSKSSFGCLRTSTHITITEALQDIECSRVRAEKRLISMNL